MKLKKIYFFGLSSLLMLNAACYEDKGNYDYNEIPVITAENMPEQITMLQKVDPLIIKPTIKSSLEGVIDENNSNFEFGCLLYTRSGRMPDGARYMDINEAKQQKIECMPNVDPGEYVCWYTVKDKRSDVVTNFKIDVKITSNTYEGWMVLCNEGEQNRVRLDLISVISKDRINAIHDILGMNAPLLNDATGLLYYYSQFTNPGDQIYICCKNGVYELNKESLQTTAADNILQNYFILPPTEEIPITIGSLYANNQFTITNKGNLYMGNTLYGLPSFETPINTFIMDETPVFEVAPFIGTPQTIPLEYGAYIALFYDKTNKRFLRWDENRGSNICSLLDDPADAKFSFTTNMNMIAMESTKFAGATVYSVLENDTRQRYVCGINLAGGAFAQNYYQQIQAPDFENATQFAFHPLYPYMFYNEGTNKINCFHLQGQGLRPQSITLDGETITLMKFNSFQTPGFKMTDTSDEYLEQERYLIVGSYKNGDADVNNGIVRFYKFDNNTATLVEVAKYTGFAKVCDVVYRERHK